MATLGDAGAGAASACTSPYRSEQQRHLQRHYGYPSLHPEQQTAIDAILSGKDVSVIAPTSFGKSLIYIIPALVRFHLVQPSIGLGGASSAHAVTIVISPLLALMNDQVAGLRAKKVPSAMLSSSQTPKQNSDVLSSLTGSYPPPYALIYVTAERVTAASFLNTLARMHKQRRLALFAVDESHCISQYGHDFRKSYAQLGVLRGHFPDIPIVALTGSARPRVARHILDSLKIPNALKVQKSFLRNNIRYVVEYVDGSLCSSSVEQHMVDYICGRPEETGIVYVHKRTAVEDLVRLFKAKGISCVGYHGAMTNKSKRIVQEEFETGKARVCVATNAFGMGIDVSCVRYVLNHSLPASMEAYYQESGRAGRDGLPSTSVLYYGEEDARLKRYLASNLRAGAQTDSAAAANAERTLAAVEAVISYCNSASCRRVSILKHFGEAAAAADICGPDGCDVCADVRAVKRRMLASVPTKHGRHRRGGGGFLPSSLVVATPAIEFQSARMLARTSIPEDSIDHCEDPGAGDDTLALSCDGDDEDDDVVPDVLANGVGFVSAKKRLLELAAAEEAAEESAGKRSRGTVNDRMKRRLGLGAGFRSACDAFGDRRNVKQGDIKLDTTVGRGKISADPPVSRVKTQSAVTVVDEVSGFTSDSSAEFVMASFKYQRR